MGNAFRYTPFPTYYPDFRVPVTADTVDAGIILAYVTVFFAFLVVLPGIRGWLPKLFILMRVTFAIWLGLMISLGNFGMEWEIGDIVTTTQYKAFTPIELHDAHIGIKMGLRGINITLTAPEGNEYGETINYNERFFWTWDQGRLGFGTQAGEIAQQFRDGQWRGKPYPILWIVEYFTIDGEQIRWGRKYRTSGWYVHAGLWVCFCLWAIMCVLFLFSIRSGGWILTLIGALMVLCIIIWSTNNINDPEIEFPFEDAILRLHYGAHWYLTLFTGLISVGLGIAIVLLDIFFPIQIAAFFGIDPLITEGVLATREDDDEEEEETKPRNRLQKTIYNLTKGNEKVREFRTTRIKGRTQRSGRSVRKENNEVQLEKLTEAST
ncbi:Dual oxidase maturation factor 1 [Oopsacas minuta]|uniref:Dual oxidase maturation factor 1 n=1 Tax=Oopsacas minuta TaxID=111878 RepID=A0AAV7JJW3_9METZ|nr:Dual oxidase maturation factor 1 [Oopsacas minuta]